MRAADCADGADRRLHDLLLHGCDLHAGGVLRRDHHGRYRCKQRHPPCRPHQPAALGGKAGAQGGRGARHGGEGAPDPDDHHHDDPGPAAAGPLHRDRQCHDLERARLRADRGTGVVVDAGTDRHSGDLFPDREDESRSRGGCGRRGLTADEAALRTVRLRFAPSPTGYLHVGGARTALFNWLLARQAGGAFVLRVEDTDRDRSRPEHVDAILGGLSWLGIDWDEGPVFQADGLARHRRDAQRLLDAGRAYLDFTAREDFERARDAAVAAGTGTVARLAREMAAGVSPEEGRRRAEAGEPFAVRFLVPPGTTEWQDLVHGPTRFDNGEIDDFVILRSDGTPTYNLAVVSDDVEMAITHVVRGDDHISNTPKQILLYEALGAPVPAFGHLPLILGPDGKRLSKRHGARAVEAFEAEGVLPDAMVNFLALLGWSPGTDEELLSRDDLIERFSLERVLKKGAVFDAAKLFWMNGQYIARMEAG
ncbi:MAG: glutamate--tRNA ligase, partial [Gemmatimonadetes bacterium]|nr:glutamate--tRNA ligase [Gemmatimonadota bacterium]